MMNPVVREYDIRLDRMSMEHKSVCGGCGRDVEILINPRGDHLVRHAGPRCGDGGRRFAEEVIFSPIEDVDLWPGDRIRFSFGGSRRSKIFVFRRTEEGGNLRAVAGPFGGG